MAPETLRHLVDALNQPALASCWTDDMTLGWVYQYWNDPAPELAAAAPAPSTLAAPAASSAAENLAEAIRAQLGLTAHIRPLAEPSNAASPGARAWARLIARMYEVDPLHCRRCGGNMQLIALITERTVIVRILEHIGEPSRAPRMAPIRGPPGDGAMQERDDRWTRRSHHPDPPVDVMPDLRKPEPGSRLVSENPPKRAQRRGDAHSPPSAKLRKRHARARMTALRGRSRLNHP